MDSFVNSTETVEYRVALIDSSLPTVIAAKKPGGYHLPIVRIPKWSRPAEEISGILRRDWQVNVLVLNVLYRTDGEVSSAVAEMLPSTEAKIPSGLTLRAIESLNESELDFSERIAIHSAIAGHPSEAHSFSRRGWLKEAQAWIRTSVPSNTCEFTEEFRQYNAGDGFVLVRLAVTDGDSYWIKGTGEPNKHECALTVELSRLFPEYLPQLIAVHEDWNAWLTKDAGHPLGTCQNVELLISAVEALADLQILSLDHVEYLKMAGFMDRGLTGLQASLPAMFAFLEEAMYLQTSTKSTPLTSARIQQLQVIVNRACHQMRGLGIPDCLVNGDINLDNILYDGAHFRFTDWAEGGIGNPFLTLQQIIQHVTREGKHLEWAPLLCEAYKNKWRSLLAEQQIEHASALMPLITIVAYLYGRGDWLGSPRQQDPSFQSFARTLGRCMDRAAVELSSSEVLLA